MSFFRRWLLITVLGFSGGIIFLLPWLFEVFYTPLGSALGLNHTELGSLVSIFGIVSMICYFPGGWLADRVSSRKLITTSLLATGVGRGSISQPFLPIASAWRFTHFGESASRSCSGVR